MYRDKTIEQKVKEAEIWEVIEKAKARERQSELNGKTLLRENFPQAEVGRTNDIVAKQVGIGSGKTLESAKIVVKKINELREAGDIENAEFLSNALNKSVSGARKLAEENIIDDVPDIHKSMLKDGIISVSEAYDVGKLVVENKKKSEESQKQYEEILAKEKHEREEKQRIQELEASLPENAVVLDKFRKPEETHIFDITDFNNLTEEQYNKCFKHCKKYEDIVHKASMLYTDLDCLQAWNIIYEKQEEIKMELESIEFAIKNLLKIQNYFKGVKRND